MKAMFYKHLQTESTQVETASTNKNIRFQNSNLKVGFHPWYKQTLCLHFESLYFLKYHERSEILRYFGSL